MVKNLLYCTLFLLITSCASIAPPEFRGSEGMKLEKIDGRKISLTAGVKVYNPNWFGVKVKPSNVEVYIENKYVGKAFLEKKVKMKAKRESTLKVPIRAELEEGALLTLLKYSTKDQVELHFKGVVKGGVFIFSKKIEIDQKQHIQGRQLRFAAPKEKS